MVGFTGKNILSKDPHQYNFSFLKCDLVGFSEKTKQIVRENRKKTHTPSKKEVKQQKKTEKN